MEFKKIMHGSQERKIEYFINALLNGGADEAAAAALVPSERAVKVQEVTPRGMVIFRAALNTVKFLQTIIKSPEKLVQFVYHTVREVSEPVEEPIAPAAVVRSVIDVSTSPSPSALKTLPSEAAKPVIDYSTSPSALSTLKSTGDARSGALSASASDRPEQLDLTAHQILQRIFTQDFIDEFGLKGYVAVEYAKATNHHDQPSEPSVRRKVAGYEIVQLAFSKPEQIINILAKTQVPINAETDIEATEITETGTSIFSIRQFEKQVDTVFNVAAFRQMLQHNVRELDGTAPVIAQVENNTYSIELDSLKSYVGHHVSEIIFNPEDSENGQVYRPIGIPQKGGMFSDASGINAELDINKKALFHIGIDVSGSMKASLSTCIQKLSLILEQITESTENWTIVLTDFNNASRSSTFDSDTHTLQNLNSHVASFSACGMTKLYGTMHEQFDKVLQDSAKYSSVAVIVFTDGVDNASDLIGPREVTDFVLKSRENVGNLQIYTVELGDSNAAFFTQLAVEAGCTHIKLNNIEQFAQLEQYASSLAADSCVLEFLSESMQTYRQVMVEGEISVGTQTVSANTEMSIAGVRHHVSQPTLTSEEVVDTPYQVFDGVFNSGLLSPKDELMLQGLLTGAIFEESADI